jgi:hypothetical protein
MTREALGEFEHMVLLAIRHLGDGVYGVPIVDEIQLRTGRSVAPAADSRFRSTTTSGLRSARESGSWSRVRVLLSARSAASRLA